ncbi:related to Fructose-2,6-bisphosphatase [Hanseniaspora guilliermondii]|uniref:fructose-2,6-bisphosphate 2-phosphatase n=1 Tax=Hanseniaspora guilliermondii TaxID=56406 RepID=A0A1L0CL64_9ASCO|nr:related to Fructose-2,6-bisphosphatase [Hanseniaspora guilliermondii]
MTPSTSIKNHSNKNLNICVILVGLPCRGKTFISNKIKTYLTWMMINSKIFNIGDYRRKQLDSQLDEFTSIDADFYNFENQEGLKIRLNSYENALKDMEKWFLNNEGVAILDGTSSTRSHRKWLLERLRLLHIEPLFIESFSDDKDLERLNINALIKSSPDKKDFDFYEMKIKNYLKFYESMNEFDDEKDYTFVKLMKKANGLEQAVINKVQSYLESKIIFYVMNLNYLNPSKVIWLSRHGESVYNVEKKIGGDSRLSERGLLYAKKLPQLLKEQGFDENNQMSAWTSTLVRTNETAQYLPFEKILPWRALNELDAGLCDGMTYEEIEEKYPEDFKERDDDKFEYRYKGGESYKDVVLRVEPVMMELERQSNVLIITHQAVLRCIYAYFMNIPQDQSPWVAIPLHTLIKLEVRPYGACKVTLIKANIPAVSTYKEKGTSNVGEDASIKNNSSRNLLADTM